MKITKDKFITYENIRLSGRTNMFSIGTVITLSKGKLNKEDCLDIMKNYSKYKDLYYGKNNEKK
ncbi:MAG: hypothetical protein WA057_01590 [Candidatus Magasanikiibacteriota bacterium]